MKAGMPFQPGLDFGVIMRAVVIQNHMDGQLFGSFTVDLPQKFSKFDVPMSWVTRAYDLSLQHIQRREAAVGPVAFVIMRHRPTTTYHQWQYWLRTDHGLHL